VQVVRMHEKMPVFIWFGDHGSLATDRPAEGN
jgi:hypothetical protein